MNSLLRHEQSERIFSGQTTLQPFANTSEVDLFEVTADNGGSLYRKMNDEQIEEWLNVRKTILLYILIRAANMNDFSMYESKKQAR